MKPEVWSAFHGQLSSFRPYEKFESTFIVKKDICLFNLSDKDNECVSIQRLFRRKDSSFQFVPERVQLNEPEVDHLPENEHDLNYDADNPYGLYELTDSMCKCLTKYISNNISLFVKMDCDVCENDNGLAKVHECMNVNERDCFHIYFERALYMLALIGMLLLSNLSN
ncbi:PC4 domain-containing protein [Nephila pilipes]|uniref:PC4 domain-containing protein n=1 Tax=Nephila pilipes TaxID=299642 RepID=A0A8X6TW00_NEPPI|nr:PC4 domain-containing protein [Nephila pilipes]